MNCFTPTISYSNRNNTGIYLPRADQQSSQTLDNSSSTRITNIYISTHRLLSNKTVTALSGCLCWNDWLESADWLSTPVPLQLADIKDPPFQLGTGLMIGCPTSTNKSKQKKHKIDTCCWQQTRLSNCRHVLGHVHFKQTMPFSTD